MNHNSSDSSELEETSVVKIKPFPKPQQQTTLPQDSFQNESTLPQCSFQNDSISNNVTNINWPNLTGY